MTLSQHSNLTSHPLHYLFPPLSPQTPSQNLTASSFSPPHLQTPHAQPFPPPLLVPHTINANGSPATNHPTHHSLPILPHECTADHYHIRSILTTNRDAKRMNLIIGMKKTNWGLIGDPYSVSGDAVCWYAYMLGWGSVFRYEEELARVRFVTLINHDILGVRNWESRDIDSQSGVEEFISCGMTQHGYTFRFFLC
ncbi:hypothetical protein EAE96_010093 [Botrytis aclada]|nr:hypothetical protein EAE96_010093 [Botrytis aclada]